jgi:hypothetical protein
MKYDEVYEFIGEFGRYQVAVFVTVFSMILYTVDSLHMVFVGGSMDHWCRVDELSDLPYDVQKYVAIPSTDNGEYSSCSRYALDYSRYNESDFYDWNRTTAIANNTPIVDCSGQWTYDQSTFQSTIVSKFNLVCGWDFLNQFVSTMYMIGVMIGSLSSGALSDRFGRRKTMLIYSMVKITGICMSVFANNYILFVAGRTLIGIGQAGYFYLDIYSSSNWSELAIDRISDALCRSHSRSDSCYSLPSHISCATSSATSSSLWRRTSSSPSSSFY